MTSTRENPKHTLVLFDNLGRAFSAKICGAATHKSYSEWAAYLTMCTEQKSIDERQKLAAESKKPAPGPTEKITRFSPALYVRLWNEFATIKKIDPSGNPLLLLIGHFYRIAGSLDFIENLERENEFYQRQLSEKKYSESIRPRPDASDFSTRKTSFEEKCLRSYKPQIAEMALTFLQEQFNKHATETKTIVEEINTLEEKIANEEDADRLTYLKTRLLEKITEKKAELKTDLTLTIEKKAERLPIIEPFNRFGIFKSLQEEYDNLNQQIITLNQYYEEQQQKTERTSTIPIILAKSVEELYVIQHAATTEKRFLDDKLKNIERIIQANNPYWLSFPEEWKELKDQAMTLHKILYQPTKDVVIDRDTIPIRIQQLQAQRETLIRQQRSDETKRIKDAEDSQYALAHETKQLRDAYENYSQCNNQEIVKAYKNACKIHSGVYKQQDSQYDALKKRVEKITLRKSADERKIQPHHTARIDAPSDHLRTTLLPHHDTQEKKRSAPLPEKVIPPTNLLKKAKTSAACGTIAASAGAAAIVFLAFPIGWIIGGAFALMGMTGWIASACYYKNHRSSTSKNISSVPLSSITDSKNSTSDIRDNLARVNPIASKIRSFGLNPEKAKADTKGGLRFSLTNGKFLHFSVKGMRLYDKNNQTFATITSTKIPQEISLVISDEYRLRV